MLLIILLFFSFIRCGAAVLTVECAKNLVVSGVYTRKVLMFDPRASANPVHSYTAHRQAVLSVALCDSLIFSASEDQTLAIWDQRAGRVLKRDLKVNFLLFLSFFSKYP